MSGEILQVMLTLRNQIKVYHWTTSSYARHKATDELVDRLDSNIDKFTECYMGRYGRPTFSELSGRIQIHDVADTKAATLLEDGVEWLNTKLPRYLKKTDTDLLNIRDEILGDIQQARYLFTLE